MKQSVRLGQVRGIVVGAHWSVAVILVIIAEVLAVSVLPAAVPHQRPALYWTAGVLAAALFLASLLAHELAHALVARRSGVAVRSITLWMLGGVTEFEGEPPTPAADFRVAAAGPAASLLAGGIFYGLAAAIHAAGGSRAAVAAGVWLALMNGILAVFNLLPGAPLDGGRVLRAALWRHWGDRERAERATARAGQALGAVIVGLGVAETLAYQYLNGLWLVLIGWFLISAAGAEGQASATQAALADLRVADIMTPHPDMARGWRSVEEFAADAATSRQDAFPVVGYDGNLTGVVLRSQLARIPQRDRARLQIEQAAITVPPGYLAAPDNPAGPLAGRTPLGGQVIAVVLADHQVTGIVTASDLKRAQQRKALTGART